MKKEIFMRDLQEVIDRTGGSETIELVDENGNSLSCRGINDEDPSFSRNQSAFVSSEEDTYSEKDESTACNMMAALKVAGNFGAKLIFAIFDKQGNQKTFNNAEIHGVVNDGNGSPDKIRIGLSNK